MRVIPSLNALNYSDMRGLVARVKQFLPQGEWVHVDVGDGKLATIKSWGDPSKFKNLHLENYRIEAHLMVENPDEVVEEWLKVGVARVIVHVEAVKNIAEIHKKCLVYGADLMLALSPETPVEHILMYVRDVRSFMILAVTPGKFGQKFRREVLDKIVFLRKRYPGAFIEVDGGVTFDTIGDIKKMGVQSVAVHSALFESSDAGEVYKQMSAL